MEARPAHLWCLAATLAAVSVACADDEVGAEGSASTSETSATASATAGETSSESGELPSTESESESESGEAPEIPALVERTVFVTLDGEPVEGATVVQGGTGKLYATDADGRVEILVDTTVPGDLGVMGSHVEARTTVAIVYPQDPEQSELLLELTRYQPGDNIEYEYNPAGVPGVDGTTAECGHCHKSLKEQWHASPHRSSASNPAVQDVYAGAATAFASQASCEAAGGQWWAGIEPGTGEATTRCYLGAGTLPDLNVDCGDDGSCDGVAEQFGACADCHAPAIDGIAGGRDLLAATGTAYEAGVHCDLCHKVDALDLDPNTQAGVGGRLVISRPFELPSSPGTGLWRPLSFGPYADVPNPRMGATPRDHFLTAEFCSGCHQHDQSALVPGASVDPGRWPEGTFPVHSTYEEWRGGPFNGIAPCSSCHMPADAMAANGADLVLDDIPLQGIARGWLRPPGAVRKHSWVGPRTPASAMLQLAAAVFVDKSVEANTLTATINVRNAGAGHAIPTGEPLRSLLLFVSARCGDERLRATGGDVVPEFGGWLDRKQGPEDWSTWPGAEVGDVVRVVIDEGWHDYEGFGPFGDGSFSAAQKGMPQLRVVGQATITAVNGDAVEFDAPLPAGDIAYRGRTDPFSADPLAAEALAGAPGFGFARVLADADGATMVPHHAAVDVVSDNRLLPQTQWQSTHVFETSCPDPIVDARLVHRAYPIELAVERGWDNPQQVMVEVSQ